MIVTNAMDVLPEHAWFDRLRPNCSVLNNSTIAKLFSLSSPSYIFGGNDSSRGVISAASVPDKEEKGCGELINVDGQVEVQGFQKKILGASDLLFRGLREQKPKQSVVKSPQNVRISPVTCETGSSNQIKTSGNHLAKSPVASTVSMVERSSLGVSRPHDVCDEKSPCGKISSISVEEHVDLGDSEGSILLNKITKPLTAAEDEDDNKNAACLEVPIPEPFTDDTGVAQDERRCCQGPCPEDVLMVLDKPSDAGGSGTSNPSSVGHERQNSRSSGDPKSVNRGRNIRGSDGVWELATERLGTAVEGEFIRFKLSSAVEKFLPIPGDIMITETPRRPFPSSYLEPNPGGNVTVFVDRNYFERDQVAKDEMMYQMSRFFSSTDIIIRYGKFASGWRWQPHAHIEFFICKGNPQSGKRWYAYSRLPNNLKLGPPDPYNPITMVYNRLAPALHCSDAFVPRTTDIIIRPSEGQTYFVGDPALMFPPDTYFMDGDLIMRPSIEKWRTNAAYLKFTADLYMFERTFQEPRWVFRGRDVQLFGPPSLDHMGREQVLDLNGIEPFVRRPIPHWGFHEAVFGTRGPPDLPP